MARLHVDGRDCSKLLCSLQMTDPPPPYRPKTLSQSQFEDLRKDLAEATGPHRIPTSVPPGFDEAIGRAVRHFARWVAYTKAGTAVAGAIAAAIGGLVTALIHKLTHFLGP